MQVTLPISINAADVGNRIAIVSQERQLDWSEFAELIARFAAILRSHGVAADDRVAVLADNCELYLAAFFAVPWAGGIIMPINLRLSAAEIAAVIEDGKPVLILHDLARADLLAAALALADIAPHQIALRGSPDSIDGLLPTTAPMADALRCKDETASIFYTGGTTGRPKGVMLTHDNHMYNSLGMWSALSSPAETIRYLHAPPMFHIADALFIHAVSVVGGLHVILPRFSAEEVILAVARHEISDLYLVPTMIHSFLDALEQSPRALPSLKRIYYGAMPMPETTLRRLMAVLPEVGPIQLYGQTEAAPVVTALLPADHDLTGTTDRLRSAGRPLPGTAVAIQAADGRPLPPFEIGEIVTRSGNVMKGYWRDREQTAAALRGGWLHTGDAGYRDADGFLFVVDRIKDMIISGGENIYSVEVERAVTLHPAVAQCAVVGVPDPIWGERVHAVVVLRAGASLTHEELRAHCRRHIASFKLPRSLECRASLPLSGPGKILKRQLRDELCATMAGDRRGEGG